MRQKDGGIILVVMILLVSVLGAYAKHNNFRNTGPNVDIFETIGRIYEPVTITGVASDKENNIKIFKFDFGDGEHKSISKDDMDLKYYPNGNTSFFINHTYKTGGRYTVKAEVTDSYGLNYTSTANVTIYPIADAGEDQVVRAGESVFFSGRCEVIDAVIIEYFWSFNEDTGLFDICINGRDKLYTEWSDIKLPSGHLLTIGWFNTTWRYEGSGVVTALFEVHTTSRICIDTCTITVLPKKNNTISGDMK